MKIKSLTLENFRGFENLTIDFPEGESGMAVFVGENGSGKSSVLEGLVSLLFEFYEKLYTNYKTTEFDALKFINFSLGKKDFKANKEYFNISTKFRIEDSDFIAYISCTDIPIDWEIKPQFSKSRAEGDFKRINENSLPLIIFLPTDRIINSSPSLKVKNISNYSPFNAYEGAFQNKIDFDSFFEWFRNSEDFENEQIRATRDGEFRLKELESIRNAIQKLLPQFSNFRVQRQPREEFILEKGNEKLSISNLSHGEKILLAMCGDIARRLSIANPKSENPLLGEGVVLIDEIELHLHPSWQRMIIPKLRKIFPNIQFILTTHSPQVLSNVPKENVFILEDFQLADKNSHTLGRDSNSILYDVFNVEMRPAKGKKDVEEVYQFIDSNEREKAEAKLEELIEKFGEGDKEVIRAQSFIEMMEE